MQGKLARTATAWILRSARDDGRESSMANPCCNGIERFSPLGQRASPQLADRSEDGQGATMERARGKLIDPRRGGGRIAPGPLAHDLNQRFVARGTRGHLVHDQ